MPEAPTPIDPDTKVATLLALHPTLEEELIAFAPPFKKLKNPLLRNSIGRVATLRQAAAVARVPVVELVNHLRALAGQPLIEGVEGKEEDYFPEQPEWFTRERVVAVLDERVDRPDESQMAVVRLLQRARTLSDGEILELQTPFLPAPGISVMRRKGYRTWCREEADGTVHTFFCKG
jgi:hypothetical protein